jgi:RNA polymerase sigma factor (TIGR02999 family)
MARSRDSVGGVDKGPGDVTELLMAWSAGSPEADTRLIEAVYRELRRLAARQLHRERDGHTLQPTALVNEVYLRLIGQAQLDWKNRGHFFAVASREMRRVLVDHARKRRAIKRNALAERVEAVLDVPDPRVEGDVDVLTLHEALTDLARLDSRQADLVELRYFGGLTIEEVGAVTGLSPATIKRELTSAKLWLRYRMQQTPPGF